MASDFALTWRGTEVLAAIKSEGPKGVRDGAELLLDASNQRVPVDSGELKGSGEVISDGLTAAVSYGAAHALIVHEDMEAHHSRGQAKFLEAALAEEQRELLAAIAASIKLALSHKGE